jgi:flagellar biosynthesis/type III secretory pathway protein FliH
VVTGLLEWLSGPEQDTLRRAFTVWFRRVLFPARFDDGEQPVLEELTEVKTMLAERVKEWNRESMERGVQKGIQKGIQKGAVEVLARQLEKKFGKLAPDFFEQLHSANEKQIIDWSERILFADTLGDVFGN